LRCLGDLETIDAIPYLIDLLEFSYQKDIKTGVFDNKLDSLILDYLYKIALVSERHFNEVVTSLEKIRKEKTCLNEKAKHLINRAIENINSQFYMNLAESCTIEDAKRKLTLISIPAIKTSEQNNIKDLKKTMLEQFEKVNKNLKHITFDIQVVQESIDENEIENTAHEKENAEKLLKEILSRLDKIQHSEKDKILSQLNGELSTSAKLKLTDSASGHGMTVLF